MSKATFLNVMSPATANGNIDLTFTQANIGSPSSFTITLPLTAGLSEKKTARAIWQTLNTGFTTNDAKYSGQPVFPVDDGDAPFTFQHIQTDHIISIWSQSDYVIDVDSNDTGAYIELSPAPIFSTIQSAKDLAAVTGVKLLTADNICVSDTQLIGALRAAASKIVGRLGGFNIIPSTYLQVESGEWQRGVNCRYAPVLRRSPIMKASPTVPGFTDVVGLTPVQRVRFDEWNGSIFFLDWLNAIDTCEIAETGTAIVWSYVAGHNAVSDSLAQITMQTLSMAKSPFEIASVKGASFSLTFKDPAKAEAVLTANLAQFAV